MELTDLERQRVEKLERLQARKIEPYPRRVKHTHTIAEAITAFETAEIAGKEGPEIITHIVRKNETLASIAKHFKVSVATLKTYNNIKNERRLQIGQKLKVPLSKRNVLAKTQEKKMFTYRVKRGDSLSKIASTFGVSVSQLKKWNNFEGSLIYPGSRIKVWY